MTGPVIAEKRPERPSASSGRKGRQKMENAPIIIPFWAPLRSVSGKETAAQRVDKGTYYREQKIVNYAAAA